MTTTRPLRLAAAAAVLTLPLALAACGDALENAAEKAIEDAANENGVDVDIDGDDIGVETTDGSFVTGKLPDGFPDLPLVDGEVLAGGHTKNPEAWNATIKVAEPGGDTTAPFDAAESALLDAGFEPINERVDHDAAIVGDYSGDGLAVNLTVTDVAGEGVLVSYLASPTS